MVGEFWLPSRIRLADIFCVALLAA